MSKLILVVLLMCTMSSCITVRLDDDTKTRVDAALVEVKRVSDILEEYQKDIKAFVTKVDSILDRFAPKPKKDKDSTDKAEKEEIDQD